MYRLTYATKPVYDNENGRILAGKYVGIQETCFELLGP